MEAELITTGDAARRLNVDPNTVRDYERTGRLPAIRTPMGIRLFRAEDVEAFRRDRELRAAR